MKKTYMSESLEQHVSIHSGDGEALHMVSWSEFWFKDPEKLCDLDNVGCNFRKLNNILEQESPPRLHSSTSASFPSCHRSLKTLIYSEARLVSIIDMWFCTRELLLMISRRMFMWRRQAPRETPSEPRAQFSSDRTFRDVEDEMSWHRCFQHVWLLISLPVFERPTQEKRRECRR